MKPVPPQSYIEKLKSRLSVVVVVIYLFFFEFDSNYIVLGIVSDTMNN